MIDPATNVLVGHRFVRCVLIGPAVVGSVKNSTFQRVNWGGALDDVFLVVPSGTRLAGVIGFEECEFIDTSFARVGFIGDPYALAKVQEHTND